MQSPLAAATPFTLADPLDLAASVRDVRLIGWAAAPNEALIGMNAIAAPIFDALGRFAGSLAAVDSIQFIPEEPPANLVEGLVSAAARISHDLGWRPARSA